MAVHIFDGDYLCEIFCALSGDKTKNKMFVKTVGSIGCCTTLFVQTSGKIL